MAFDFSQFDATQVDTSDEFEAIPAGQYPMMLKEAMTKSNNAGTGTNLVFKGEVIDGNYKGRIVFCNLSIDNPNQTTVKIAIKQLAKLCMAVGLPRITSPEQLNGKIFVGVVGLQKDDKTRNELKDFKPMEGAQQPQTQQFQQPAPQQQPAQSSPPFGAKKPPFMK